LLDIKTDGVDILNVQQAMAKTSVLVASSSEVHVEEENKYDVVKVKSMMSCTTMQPSRFIHSD